MSFCITALAIGIAQFTLSVPVESITAHFSAPIVPRNGVLMVRLISETLGNNWPSEIDVIMEDGEVAQGHVAWVELVRDGDTWTNLASHIRPIELADDTSHINPKDVVTGPVLLVDLQNKKEGIIRFGGDVIDPEWIDLPSTLPNLNLDEINQTKTLPVSVADNLPQWEPLEYWRWTLIASSNGIQPPLLTFTNEVSRLAALHSEQLWRIGFDRLAKSSRGIAAECRDLLTNTANDHGHSYACWTTQPESLQRLLSIILDMNSSSRQLAMRALNWCSEQQLYIYWLEKVYGTSISIAVANPTHELGLIALQWKKGDDIPLVVDLPRKATSRISYDRIQTYDLPVFGPTTSASQIEWLSVQIGNNIQSIPIVPESITALPPGIQLQALHPVWNLRTVHTQTPSSVSAENKTSVQLRKLLDRWELFIKCNGLPGENTKGIEGITIFHPSSSAELFIPPKGNYVSSNVPSETNVFQSTAPYGWTARVELPDEWVADETFVFSVLRSHGDSNNIESGPLPCVPWNLHPAPIVVDLSEWDDINRFPTHSEK
jgi:hypothetical protein